MDVANGTEPQEPVVAGDEVFGLSRNGGGEDEVVLFVIRDAVDIVDWDDRRGNAQDDG